MKTRKLIPGSLIVLGTVWLVAATWIHLTMTAFTEPILPIPAYLALTFGPPFFLIVSAIIVFVRASRIAAVCCLTACGFLIYLLVPEWLSMVVGFFRRPQPLQFPSDNVDYLVATAITLLISWIAVAGWGLLRSLIHSSNQTLERTADRCTLHF